MATKRRWILPRWTHFRQQVWSDGVGLTAPRRPVLGPAFTFDPAIVGATRLADSASKRDNEATCRASRRMRARLVQTGSGKHHTFRCCLQVALPTRGHVRRRRTDSPAGRRQRQVEGRSQCWARTESTPCTSAWNGSMSHTIGFVDRMVRIAAGTMGMSTPKPGPSAAFGGASRQGVYRSVPRQLLGAAVVDCLGCPAIGHLPHVI